MKRLPPALAGTVCLFLTSIVTFTAPATADHRHEAATGIRLEATRFFSPNGDGTKERASIRYVMPRDFDDVSIRIRVGEDGGRVVRELNEGPIEAGTYLARWDGRREGEVLADGRYVVEIIAQRATGPAYFRKPITLDTHFSASRYAERYGAERTEPNRVYPRSTEVRDALPIRVVTERALARGRLMIRDDDHRVVFRRDVTKGDVFGYFWTLNVGWTARKDGKALPVGLYRAVVSGVDKAGNRGRTNPLRIRVSRDKLVWQEGTRTLPASETSIGCSISTGNDCGLSFYCGSVEPSIQFVGGLSHLSTTCPPNSFASIPEAQSWHIVSVPEAVRGIDRARVSFTGAPTHAGETDPGTLYLGETTTTSATSAVSPWVEDAPLSNGRVATAGDVGFPPSAFWRFGTTGDDAFDVATFTVDLRYLREDPPEHGDGLADETRPVIW